MSAGPTAAAGEAVTHAMTDGRKARKYIRIARNQWTDFEITCQHVYLHMHHEINSGDMIHVCKKCTKIISNTNINMIMDAVNCKACFNVDLIATNDLAISINPI